MCPVPHRECMGLSLDKGLSSKENFFFLEDCRMFFDIRDRTHSIHCQLKDLLYRNK